MIKNTIAEDYFIEFDLFDSTDAIIRITAPTKEEIISINSILYAALSYFDTKSMYTWEYEEGFTDGVVYIYNKEQQTFPIGLIPRVTKYLKDRKPNLKIKITDGISKTYKSPTGVISNEQISKYVDTLNLYNIRDNTKIVPYEHQLKLVNRALNGRRISLLACTSSGKSLSMCIISRYLMEIERKKNLTRS